MEFIGKIIFLTAFGTMIISQILKMVVISIKEGKFHPEAVLEIAGMPSSHTATITSLTLGIYFAEGFSSLFAFSLISLVYVIDEVLEIERSVGHHSKIINQILVIFNSLKNRPKNKHKLFLGRLRESWGHTDWEVVFGFLLGLFTTYIVHIL